jgi:phosphoribosylglycinamide formyltransferase-1
MIAMKKLVILVSGRGSNMVSIAQSCQAQGWNARIAAVISNRPDALGLVEAQRLHLNTEVVDHRAHAKRDQFDAALNAAIDRFEPDLVVLAGFMRILTEGFVRHYTGRMMNIHPSLLPAFTGLHTHERAISAGCLAAGATVHMVTPELDGGPILAQAVVPVLPGDDAARLAARVLEKEHVLYPRVIRWWLDGLLQQRADGRYVVTTGESQLLM